MPNTREKLISLIRYARRDIERICKEHDDCLECPAAWRVKDCKSGFIADRLIAGGVTVNEWVSVEDRYPSHGDVVLIYTKHKEIQTFQWDATTQTWVGDSYDYATMFVTHWMPLPEPPKTNIK